MTTENDGLKSKLRSMWMSGDYGHFATYMYLGSLEFFESLGIEPGMRVLDVACGAGQLSLPAAEAGADVTAVDIAANLIEQARDRAEKAGLSLRFEEGDAEALPFSDNEFDLAFSFIGAMFAPRPELVAAELSRVVKRGGKVMMGNWTPEGHVGAMFKIHAKHLPPPPGVPPAVRWGDEETVRDRFGPHLSKIEIRRRMFPFTYPFPPEDVVEFFRAYYGPTNLAFRTLDEEKALALRSELVDLWSNANTAGPGKTAVLGEYLEIVGTK